MKGLSPDMKEYLFRSFYRVALGYRRGLSFERRSVKAVAAFCRKSNGSGYLPDFFHPANFVAWVRKPNRRWRW